MVRYKYSNFDVELMVWREFLPQMRIEYRKNPQNENWIERKKELGFKNESHFKWQRPLRKNASFSWKESFSHQSNLQCLHRIYSLDQDIEPR